MIDEASVIGMNMEEGFEAFKLYRQGQFEEEYYKVRFGINVSFDINEFIHGELRNKRKRGVYKIGRTNVSAEDFWTELEERTTLIKKCLLELIPDKKITRSRE